MNELTPDEISKATLSVYEGFDEEQGYIRARPHDYVKAGAKAQLAKAHRPDREKIETLVKKYLRWTRDGGETFTMKMLIGQISALFNEEGIRKELLQKAVDLIKAWHNAEAEMKLGHEQAEKMWQIYYEQSPEMKEIRQALKEGK